MGTRADLLGGVLNEVPLFCLQQLRCRLQDTQSLR